MLILETLICGIFVCFFWRNKLCIEHEQKKPPWSNRERYGCHQNNFTKKKTNWEDQHTTNLPLTCWQNEIRKYTWVYLGRGRPGWPAEPPAEPLARSCGPSWCWGSDSWPCSTHLDWLSYRHRETGFSPKWNEWMSLFLNILRKYCRLMFIAWFFDKSENKSPAHKCEWSVKNSNLLLSVPVFSLFALNIYTIFQNQKGNHRMETVLVPTFPGRAGWAVCRRCWKLQLRLNVSSSSPLGWRGGRWTAAESAFYLQTEQSRHSL